MSMLKKVPVICMMLVVASSFAAVEKDPLSPDPDAIKRWQDMRFGMFIHWGPVSLTGHEIGWSRGRETPVDEYDQLYKKFNPTEFNADQWVRVAKEAGMKYLVLTTKHHDGFCLWDTQQTDYNIMHSPFGRDVVKELSAACKKHGIAFGTYYSTCDWHHPDFPYTSRRGDRKEQYNLDRYTDYLKAQVKELITNYGPLVTLWYDVPQAFDAARGTGVISHTRSLQPDILINNRTGADGDYDTPEQRVGAFKRQRPWETCMTLCRQWAWRPNDDMKTLKECIQTLLQTAGGDGNLLFNVGPMPDGRIEPRQVERLREMGRWLKIYGDTIYGTRGGPYMPGKWGSSTCKDDKIYLFVMNWPSEGPLSLPALPMKITKSIVRTGGSVNLTPAAEVIELDGAARDQNPIVTVIELTVDGKAFDIEPIPTFKSESVAFGKPAKSSNVYRQRPDYGPAMAFDDNSQTRWATDTGTTSAWLEVDLGRAMTIHRAMIDEGRFNRVRKYELQYKVDAGWKTASAGTTLGPEKQLDFPPVSSRYFRLHILEAVEGPTIWEIQLFESK